MSAIYTGGKFCLNLLKKIGFRSIGTNKQGLQVLVKNSKNIYNSGGLHGQQLIGNCKDFIYLKNGKVVKESQWLIGKGANKIDDIKYFGSYDELGKLQGEFAMFPGGKFKEGLTRVVRDRANVGLKSFDMAPNGNIIPSSIHTISYA